MRSEILERKKHLSQRGALFEWNNVLRVHLHREILLPVNEEAFEDAVVLGHVAKITEDVSWSKS